MTKKIQGNQNPYHSHFPVGSFAVQIGDHLRSEDHFRRCAGLEKVTENREQERTDRLFCEQSE